jgi:hypothetical protein
MRLPSIEGTIRRRMLLNYRADPAVVARLPPSAFSPKLHQGHAIAGVCLIRLEGIRPTGAPRAIGLSSENAAHRIAVTWSSPQGPREGVFIPRRDTDSLISQVAGGRVFPGEHHAAEFRVSETGSGITLAMDSRDGEVSVRVAASIASALPRGSCFASLPEASAFFEPGSLGYSATGAGDKLHGVELYTRSWHVDALDVTEVQSSFFSDRSRFPEGSVVFDHALIMRNIEHEWRGADDLYIDRRAG